MIRSDPGIKDQGLKTLDKSAWNRSTSIAMDQQSPDLNQRKLARFIMDVVICGIRFSSYSVIVINQRHVVEAHLTRTLKVHHEIEAHSVMESHND